MDKEKRITIGIYYAYDENWIGGTYYYQNLIKSLNLLPNSDKPNIVILCKDSSSIESLIDIEYPYISFKNISAEPYLRKKFKALLKKVTGKVLKPIKINYNIDVFFHPSEINVPNTIDNHLYWIPDFQEVYFPELFSQEYLEYRKKSQQKLLNNNTHILFSSKSAHKDFKKIYPNANSHCYVVNFSVFHPDYSQLDIKSLREKFNIGDTKYFFCPNQFWKHKNHMVVLEAIATMIKSGYNNFKIVFSGKEFDHRNPNYFNEIKQYVNDNNLNSFIEFLGFIDRKEQLCLMKNSLAIIQPSLFEGWSTVVEDAKAMNQNIIASALDVHKEQLNNLGFYFDPKNSDELSKILIEFLGEKIKQPEFNYNQQLASFGQNFMDVVKKINQ